MKNKYTIPLVLSAVVLACLMLRPAKADQSSLADRLNAINAARVQSEETNHWVVVLSGEGDYDNTPYPVSFVVDVSTSSPGAPKFKRGDNLASALADLKNQGATITIHAWGSLTYTAIR